MLRMLLEQRFGALPAELAAKLDAADADELKKWGERGFTAESLAEVFAAESLAEVFAAESGSP